MHKNRPSPHMGTGTISLIVIFAALCMTVLALLTWQTARNEKKLVDRSLETVQTYYAADRAAAHTARAIVREAAAFPRQIGETEIVWSGNVAMFQYPIDENRALSVRVDCAAPAGRVLEWKTVNVSAWEVDTSLPVWDGREP